MEIGWIESAEKKPSLQAFLDSSHVEVAEVDGEAEAMTMWTPGSMRYQDTDLPMSGITAVTVSHVARKLGLASSLTARSLRAAAEDGKALATLGMFEQGFYDRLGFGTGSYAHQLTFDPGALQLGHVPYRRPVRLGTDDYADVCKSLCTRMLQHGSMSLFPELMVKGELSFPDRPFALGYRDDHGDLTHFVFGEMEGEHGPFRINAIGYRSVDQLLELLRMLMELGDQVRSIKMLEPGPVQLQALLREPFRERDRSRGSAQQSEHRGLAWWQFRMLDVAACVAARTWTGPAVRFNLTLDDPVEARLEGDGWSGVAGDYTITVGEHSSAVTGHTAGLPTMVTGVGSFTRLWCGVCTPSVVAATDGIDAPTDLVTALDEALLMPDPLPGWEF